MRARAKTAFQTPTGLTEVCVVAGHFIEDGFTDNDKAAEEALCQVDWNAPPTRLGVVAAGLAPRADSADPATDIHALGPDVARDVVESFIEANTPDRKGRKIGQLLSSLDPARFERAIYAPSILGYYATSRMLGNIAEVAPAVWRTLEVARHVPVAENGSRLTIAGSQAVRPLWGSFLKADTDRGTKDRLTYTSDGTQLYGAFVESMAQEVNDEDIGTMAGLVGSERFKRLVDPVPLASTPSSDLTSAVTRIVPMQGVVEMLVLDSVMLEGDRLGGQKVSFLPFVYFQRPDGSVDRMSKEEFDGLSKAAFTSRTSTVVKKLFLSDVGGGLINQDAPSFQATSPEYALLKQVAHISPELYGRVRKLGSMVQNPEFEAFSKSEWRFTDRDWYRYRSMAIAVSTLLHERCVAGSLMQDLDVSRHLAGQNLLPRQNCEP